MQSDFTVDSAADFVALPDATRQNPNLSAPNQLWSDKLLLTMALDPDGDALVLAALVNVLPQRYTPIGRNGDFYKESVDELYGVAAAQSS